MLEEKADPTTVTITAAQLELEGTPYTFTQKLRMYTGTYLPWKDTIICMIRPWYLIFRFPVVFYSGLNYGISLTSYLYIADTFAQLTSPPYNLKVSTSGNVYYAPLLGVILGGMFAGWGGDKLAIWSAKRNGGIREPEHKLPLMFFVALTATAGT
jgi:hypothetical protein